MLENQIARPLRYTPIDSGFVITNGTEFFNRPLYGNNSAFRVDAGDKPEFSLYLPGRGGNIRFGLKSADGAKWLNDAAQIVARYAQGAMFYDIRDPLLQDSTLHLKAFPFTSNGIFIQAELQGTATNLQIIFAYGGANGDRGARGGDIGTEREPVSRFFQLQPAYCRSNQFQFNKEGEFILHSPTVTFVGVLPATTKLSQADATKWQSLDDLLASTVQPPALPVILGQTPLPNGQPLFFVMQRGSITDFIDPNSPRPSLENPLTYYAPVEQHRRELSEKIIVNTPDPFVNSAASALCLAADGTWDESQGAVMHGAVAWRNKLLGWRGDYINDELGWHDRALRDFAYWSKQQDTAPIPAAISPADPASNLSRNEASLHSNGAMSKSHYDMNLVFVDALFRHFLWTGDLDFARQVWPVIQRHLAWERRLFRRPFGPDGLPLYEGYAAIWASDSLEYEGGGAAHATAYNYYHNKMAARLATLLGDDPAPYEQEAKLILTAMQRELWLPDRGWYAEYKDWLGLQSAHPAAALWTVYHTLDSEVPNPFEAWQTTRYVDTQIAHIPVVGPGVPEGYYTLPTSDWMPYEWSINNVVMAEAQHTSLAFWQANRPDEAFSLFKGSILDSMFLGLCPGNVGMTTWYDDNRRESQRDFADGIGTTSRALIEGLFGVTPDALAGELRLRPGFPSEWNSASIRHPDFNFAFQRDNLTETYIVEPKFPKPMAVRLQVVALRDHIASVTVNGAPASWKMLEDSVDSPRIEIQTPAASRDKVVITWKGEKPAANAFFMDDLFKNKDMSASFGSAQLRDVADPQGALNRVTKGSNSFSAVLTGPLGDHTVFAQLQQGALTWWYPVDCDIQTAFEIIPTKPQDATTLRFRVLNRTSMPIDRQIVIRVGSQPFNWMLHALNFSLESDEIVLNASSLLPGSNPVTLELGKDQAVEGVVSNWKLALGAFAGHWETVDLRPFFNDKVTQIFRNQYLTPRSPFVSLAMPKQGIGDWCSPNASFDVDDSGLRAASDKNGGQFLTPFGIPFQTPGANGSNNIAFTSQWDNYPREIAVPLTGKSPHLYLLLAGSSNPMQSRFDNAEVVVTYADGSEARLPLRNPSNWCPIDQDYFTDDYAFRDSDPMPPRVNLHTGAVRIFDSNPLSTLPTAGKVPGGAANILDMPLDPSKELKSLTLRTLANEVVIGLMSATLARN